MTTVVGRNHLCRPRRLFLAEFFRILANSLLKALANEIEQNRFLTLRAVEISISNGVYREKLHFSRIRNYEIRNLEYRKKDQSVISSEMRDFDKSSCGIHSSAMRQKKEAICICQAS